MKKYIPIISGVGFSVGFLVLQNMYNNTEPETTEGNINLVTLSSVKHDQNISFDVSEDGKKVSVSDIDHNVTAYGNDELGRAWKCSVDNFSRGVSLGILVNGMTHELRDGGLKVPESQCTPHIPN